MAPDQPLEPPVPLNIAPARPSNSRANAPSFARWQLLNPYTARRSSSFSLGWVGFRAGPEVRENQGIALAVGESLTTLRGPFAAGGLVEFEGRFVFHDALSLGLWRYEWQAGPRLGIVEPMVRVGFTTVHLAIGHGSGFGMFSPRAGFGIWFKLPESRIGVSAYSEYLWRWIGREGGFVHGLSLEIQPDGQPLLRPQTTSSPSSAASP